MRAAQYDGRDALLAPGTLTCEPGVLIPRPRDEALVDVALEGVDAATQNATREVRVLEVGVGTGCISLSIATERLQTRCLRYRPF